MKKIIYKHEIFGGSLLTLPVDFRILKCGVIETSIYLWEAHNHDTYTTHCEANNCFRYRVHIVGTGEEFDDSTWQYIDTVFEKISEFTTYVWHIYLEKL